MKRLAKGIVVMALLAMPACGSSGTTADDGGRGGAGSTGAAGQTGAGGHDAAVPTGEITWLDDGTPHALAIGLATSLMGNMTNSLEIVGVDPQGTYSLAISVGGPMALGGTYPCAFANGNIVEITYTQRALQPTTCTVMLTLMTEADGKQHATGTFSFDITGDAGTRSITDGHFDIPVMMETP